MKRLFTNKVGQIWVETVIYTLIGITIIGLVLAAIKPKIDEKQDEIAIDQAIQSLNNIDSKIYGVQSATGNKRSIELKVGKGTMTLHLDEDYITWEIESRLEYSEEDIPVRLGRMNVTTTRLGEDLWEVVLYSPYDIDLRFNNLNVGTKEFDAVSVPYQLVVENDRIENGKTVISIREV